MNDTVAPATLGRSDRLQPVLLIGAIGVGLGLAKLFPALANASGPLVNAGVFTLIYLVMLGLDVQRLFGAFTQRRFLSIAVVLNFVVNPALAWSLGQVFLKSEPDLRVGFILFLVTPCIGWYLIFTELAAGDTSLGVSLLGINLTLQVLLLPVYLWLFEGEASAVDLSGILMSVLLFLVAPAAIALATRAGVEGAGHDVGAVQDAIDRAHLKTAALVVVIVAMFASEADTIFDNPSIFITLLPPMGTFFVVAFATALAAAHLGKLPHDQTALLAFTTTSRNSEASLAIAATAFVSPLVTLAVVMGPIVELPFLVLMVRVLRARDTSPTESCRLAQRAASTTR